MINETFCIFYTLKCGVDFIFKEHFNLDAVFPTAKVKCRLTPHPHPPTKNI